MQTKRYAVEIRFFDHENAEPTPYERLPFTYCSLGNASRAADRIECRNMVKDVLCEARIVEVK